jgi:hypothetical protein
MVASNHLVAIRRCYLCLKNVNGHCLLIEVSKNSILSFRKS